MSLRLPQTKWLILWLICAAIAYILLFRIEPALECLLFPRSHPRFLHESQHRLQHSEASKLTANLIVASVSKDDISWTSNLQLPNLQILRYVNDDQSAEYRPFVPNKGREALMYFTYLYDHYDILPDVSIFVHAEEIPWHVEGTLLQNTTFALSQLDLHQVINRGYFNLRVTWRAACPTWIDTSKTFDDWDKREEPFMKEAWQANFGEDPPRMLGGPCCSQFAVSREAVHSRPREQYKRSRDWLAETDWSDYIAGRVWEHMWPYLFKNVTEDCTPERLSLCEMYGLCFTSDDQVSDYKELWEERERLKEQMSFLQAVLRSGKAAVARQKMDEIGDQIEKELAEAWERGQDQQTKANVLNGFV